MFDVEYSYDHWGALARITHPSWSPWSTGCDDRLAVEQEFLHDGPWLTGTTLHRSLGAIPYGQTNTSIDYHPSGRPHHTYLYGNGALVGQQIEIADAAGLPRPQKMQFRFAGNLRWEQKDYLYDGSGNVASFNLWWDGEPSYRQEAYTYDGHNQHEHLDRRRLVLPVLASHPS